MSATYGQDLNDGRFRYTVPQYEGRVRLSPAQRSFYEENGFLVVPQLVPSDLLDACRERFLDIINGKVERGDE